jgi:hypothetical protein
VAFSVGASQIDEVAAYIARQQEHHRVKSFLEGYLAYLKEYMSSMTKVCVGIGQPSLLDLAYRVRRLSRH